MEENGTHQAQSAGLEIGQLFSYGSDRLMDLITNDNVNDIRINDRDSVYYTVENPPEQRKVSEVLFADDDSYLAAIKMLLAMTDLDVDIDSYEEPVLEGSFSATRSNVRGSIMIMTPMISPTGWAAVIRKQRRNFVTLDSMREAGMMPTDMVYFLEAIVRGRANILLSGGSGVGKTTMTRALSSFIPPTQRVITIEDVAELNLEDCGITNLLSLTTRGDAPMGGHEPHASMEDLLRYALRARPDRIWVGEIRGREAYALVKACLSGHVGTVTTIHGNNADMAMDQMRAYVTEAGVPESLADKYVKQAFNIVVQIGRDNSGDRVVKEVREYLPIEEKGGVQQRQVLWEHDSETDSFQKKNQHSVMLARHCLSNGVDLHDLMSVFDTYGTE